MQLANPVIAVFLFLLTLSACHSSQPANASRDDNPEISGNRLDNLALEQVSLTIPADGKLRDEHLTMYVSVKIRQEQLRFQQKTSSTSTEKKESSGTNSHDSAKNQFEEIAMQEFGFDSRIYLWSKKMIHDTLAADIVSDSKSSPALLIQNDDALFHNLSVIAKHNDELRFADNYKLEPPSSLISQQSLKRISVSQPAVPPKPSG